MKNNIIKFVSRDVFEQRKCPLYQYLINDHLDEILLQAFRDGEFLDEKQTQRAMNYLNSLDNEATGVQG